MVMVVVWSLGSRHLEVEVVLNSCEREREREREVH